MCLCGFLFSSTAGYGNQIPSFELGRFIACSVMLFGALFLSMPLAIIGNEYDRAWTLIQDEIAEEKRLTAQKQEAETRQIAQGEPIEEGTDIKNSGNNEVVASPPSTAPGSVVAVTFADKRNLVAQFSCMTICDQIRVTLNQVQRDIKHHKTHISHHVLTSLCELKAWISSLIISTEDLLRTTTKMISANFVASQEKAVVVAPIKTSAPRRFSCVHGGGGLMMRELGPVDGSTSSSFTKPVFRNNTVAPDGTTSVQSFIPSFLQIPPQVQGSFAMTGKPPLGKPLNNIVENTEAEESPDSESSLSLSDLDEDVDIDSILKRNYLKKSAQNSQNNHNNNPHNSSKYDSSNSNKKIVEHINIII